MTFFNLRLTLVVLAVACITIGCPDRQTKAQDQKSELGVRQKLIQIKMLEVEKKFRVIADRLRETLRALLAEFARAGAIQ